MNKRNRSCIPQLVSAGIDLDDAKALRRISMTLQSWFTLECGNSDESGSWCITRGNKTAGVFVHDEDGAAYMESHSYYHGRRPDTVSYYKLPDRETGARKRLARIMSRYPTLSAYVQGDPRGAALYILRPGDVPKDADVDSCYSRGICVYK